MSAVKRSRGRHEDSKSVLDSPSAKRLKTVNGTHAPPQRGLGFLVDENARANKKIEANLTNGVAHTKSLRPDESNVVVARVADSEDEDEGSEMEDSEAVSDSSDEENNGPVDMAGSIAKQISLPNGSSSVKPNHEAVATAAIAPDEDELMEGGEGSPEREALSFGELLRSKHPDPIDVAGSYPSLADDQHAVVPATSSQALTLSAGTSLGTVLQQALKTNDKELLESCLRSNDTDTIRRTIQRLPSQHIATLLQRLAERIHKRPGRAGNLMVWVQWSLVAHGGYLAGQPALMKRLRALSQVLRERARGLQPLLHLKGKLDLLSAQMELRRQLQEESRAADAADDEDDEGVLYIEGQAEQWSDGDSDTGGTKRVGGSSRSGNSIRKLQSSTHGSEIIDHDSDDDEILNGNPHTAEVEDLTDEEEEDENEDGLLDLEAEEASDEEDELDSVEESENELDESESSAASEDESDASGIKEPKLAKLNRKR